MTITGRQLELLQAALHRGADGASLALGRWLDRPAHVTFDSIEQLTLDEATGVLGAPEDPICCCTADLSGRLTGNLVLAFDDASGLALADMLLGHARGTAVAWNEMETSAALETCNIVCCAYLNALAHMLPSTPGEAEELIPSPPRFARDFAASVLQFALMDQIAASDEVLLARTEFRIDGAPVDWTLLFVPDAASMARLNVETS
jgi:chemotaxis protein CheC